MSSESFSAQEALGLLGKEVLSCEEREGLPSGTPGRIIRIHGEGGFCVAVQWQSSGSPRYDEFAKADFQRFWTISASEN